MTIGGQAVIEGVMMRSKTRTAVAVRLPTGKIKLQRHPNSRVPKIFQLVFLRGIAGLWYMLHDGMKALVWSSNQQLEEKEQLTMKELVLTIAGSLLMAVLLFVVVPFFSVHWLGVEGLWFSILDGLLRVVLFLGYLLIIAQMKDVKTLFEYHGAEHKTIYCYEAGKQVTLQNVRSFPRQHRRCGTSFLFLVLLISIFVFSFITGPWWVRLGGRILLLPVVAGLGYEVIKLADKYQKNIILRTLVAPGLWLQDITTKEPSNRQMEVAMKALEGVVK
ncbi:DUF1385 domain-containing protein [Candidatus Woesearchaeota archaeon]|nr:DUF1385 domain-containing protein [Candidatus Woesearchaeota archaeon]